jgi:hypothetical protein
MTADQARAFIASARWRYAWTYRRFAPHWYTRRADAADEAAWTAFARYVWARGTPMHWRGPKSMAFNYTDIDGWMYWCARDEGILVNKARILETDPRTRADTL